MLEVLEQSELKALSGGFDGAIDCDVHPSVPGLKALLPYLDDVWREAAEQRGIRDLDSNSYPLNAPLTARPDWRPENGYPAETAGRLVSEAMVPFNTRIAICNCLYGVQLFFNEDMGAAFAKAVNDWIRAEWLDRDPSLRASIVVPMQNPQMSADEIDRCAGDKRFVQVLMLVMGEMPLGKRYYWPIYEAAQRHGLPIGIHAGSMYRQPVTGIGMPSYHSEDYAAQSYAFQTQLTSLIVEGVFSRYPALKVVMLESGFAWLPAYSWRLNKYWHGLRMETPWVDRLPEEIIHSNVRFSITPFDAPPETEQFERFLDHVNSEDLLLFSTDYPHWQFEGVDVLPPNLPASLKSKIMLDNPLSVYSRIRESIK